MAAIAIDRRQVLAYRAAAQGLHRQTSTAQRLAVLDLGVQDTPPGSAVQALANRVPDPVEVEALTAVLVTTWSTRGAPHLHRPEDLVDLSRALWPWSDADALARLDTSAAPVRSPDYAPRQALRFVAEQIADIVDQPTPKGEVSAALTPRIPPALTVDCRRCRATHVVETLWRSAVLPAGIRFEPGTRTVTFARVEDWPGVPADTAGEQDLVRAYLRLHGPATPREVAAFLGTAPAEVEPRWPDGLVEVAVEGRPAWIPEEARPDLADPPEPPLLRLLAPSDPWLQARDRDLVVPDRDRQRALWPILGRPGAVLVHAEVAGIWRARKQGRRLDVAVETFGRLPATARRLLDAEAEVIATARGLREVRVGVS